MSVRRKTDPHVTQRIWDLTKGILNQKSLPTSERLARQLARGFGLTEPAAQEELNKAVEDGLILSKKGSAKNGLEQESYSFPIKPTYTDDHDWYCFECQKAGLVECCQTCHRVFHAKCYEPTSADTKICKFCENIKNDLSKLDKKDLNHILSFTCGHLKAKLPPEITNRTIVFDNKPITPPAGGCAGPTWISEGEDAWRPDFLIKAHMDLAIIESKCKRKEYNNLCEYEADVHNMLHNIIVYHGDNSAIGDMGKEMYKDCRYDLIEIRRCADCYRISNEKSGKFWFCIPCNPPHNLVYAKQKGYPYWPAKVMQVKNDIYDVRFFGGHHMRANIEKMFIKPIHTKIENLQIKKSPAWNRAYEELKQHQSSLQKFKRSHDKSDKNDKNDAVKPAKIQKTMNSTDVGNNSPKPVLKNLRVTVERMDNANNGQMNEEAPANAENARNGGEELHYPELPIAEDEPAREIISSTCPQGLKKEGSEEDMVTSSCQESRTKSTFVQTEQVHSKSLPAKVKRERRTSDQPTNTAIEQLRRELEAEKCRELERLQAEHAKEFRELTEKHQQVISEIKKKQWCYNCEAEAIYHCCWNTAYCSTECQQVHWQREHKRVCRRKR